MLRRRFLQSIALVPFIGRFVPIDKGVIAPFKIVEVAVCKETWTYHVYPIVGGQCFDDDGRSHFEPWTWSTDRGLPIEPNTVMEFGDVTGLRSNR